MSLSFPTTLGTRVQFPAGEINHYFLSFFLRPPKTSIICWKWMQYSWRVQWCFCSLRCVLVFYCRCSELCALFLSRCPIQCWIFHVSSKNEVHLLYADWQSSSDYPYYSARAVVGGPRTSDAIIIIFGLAFHSQRHTFSILPPRCRVKERSSPLINMLPRVGSMSLEFIACQAPEW